MCELPSHIAWLAGDHRDTSLISRRSPSQELGRVWPNSVRLFARQAWIARTLPGGSASSRIMPLEQPLKSCPQYPCPEKYSGIVSGEKKAGNAWCGTVRAVCGLLESHRPQAAMAPWAYSTTVEIPAGRRTIATDGPAMGPEGMMAGGGDECHGVVTPTDAQNMPAQVRTCMVQ